MQYNDELKALQEEIHRKKHVKAKLESLRERERELTAQTSDLYRVMEYENSDVERLETANAVSIFYTLIGKKAEQLDKEKKEAIAAAEKYKLAEAEYKEVILDIEKCERELLHIKRCEEKYAELWKSTVNDAVAEAAEGNSEVTELRDQMLDIEARINEVDEAIAEGKKVFAIADRIVEYISFYIYVATAPKSKTAPVDFDREREAHRKLMAADNMLIGLQTQITRFRAELSDVDFDFDGEAYPYALVRASNFYSDIWVKFISCDFSDYEAMEEMEWIKSEVGRILSALEERKALHKKNKSLIKSKINKIISL